MKPHVYFRPPCGVSGRDQRRLSGPTRGGGRTADRNQIARDAGAGIFYRITANLVSSTSLNTDFAETEADTRQINLTRFPLLFPEHRQSFLEDSGIFEFAAGKIGRFDIGLMDVKTRDSDIACARSSTTRFASDLYRPDSRSDPC
jgi:hypothetical protein